MPFYGPPWYRARFPCVEVLPSVWLAVLGLVFVVQGAVCDWEKLGRTVAYSLLWGRLDFRRFFT